MTKPLAIVILGALSVASACTNHEVLGMFTDAPTTDIATDAAADAYDAAPLPDAGDPHAHDILSLVITPTDGSIVALLGAAPATQTFQVMGLQRDGTMTAPLAGEWTLSSPALGAIDPVSGVFTATGGVAGSVRVQVSFPYEGSALTTDTGFSVRLRSETYVGTTPTNAAMHFTGSPTTDGARAANIVYPLDGVVMPQNMYPADIQWTTGNAGDVYRVTLHKTDIDVVAYTLHTGASFGLDWLPIMAGWTALAQTDVTEPAQITVDRWDSSHGDVVSSPPVQLTFANGSISGVVYYWEIDGTNGGALKRIHEPSAVLEDFLPHPQASPASGENCVGCHSISHSGRYLAGRIGGGFANVGVVYDVSTDLTGTPAPSVFPVTTSSPQWLTASWNADDTRLVVDQATTTPGSELNTLGTLRLVDPMTGAHVPFASGVVYPGGAIAPAWSPDGSTIAYITDATGCYGANYFPNYSSGNIRVTPVTGPDSFGTPRMVHDGSTLSSAVEGGVTDSWPSWTPDSRWIGFQHGPDNASLVESCGVGRTGLYLVSGSGGGSPVRLDRASGGATATDNGAPVFSPFDVGGYFWLGFSSTRTYGNAHNGVTPGQSQIWVAAVQRHPDGTSDPSEVGFWLPGQSTTNQNLLPVWASLPCRSNGSDCSVTSECCSGICSADAGGTATCQPPPASMCRTQWQVCGGDGDCCNPPGAITLTCENHVCSPPPPG